MRAGTRIDAGTNVHCSGSSQPGQLSDHNQYLVAICSIFEQQTGEVRAHNLLHSTDVCSRLDHLLQQSGDGNPTLISLPILTLAEISNKRAKTENTVTKLT